MLQSLLQIGIAQRQQRALLQLRQEIPQPDAAQRYRRREIHPAYSEFTFRKIGSHQPVKIDEPHEQNEYRDRRQQLEIAFQVARQQQREGQREMSQHQGQGDVPPSAAQTF